MINDKMKTMMKAAGFVLGGLLIGWILFSGGNGASDPSNGDDRLAEHEQKTVWTCSMHPQIKLDEPGLCPICAMDLIPLNQGQSDDSPAKLEMTEAAVALASIRTFTVRKESVTKEIKLNGKVQPDERNISEITARFGGRIERLYVNFTGQKVAKGQKLASIYSPSLIAAQQELLEAAKLKDISPSFYEAAKRKLKLWYLSDSQISDIEKNGKTITEVDIVSPMTGTVLERHIDRGDYVSEGKPLFEIANLSRVWIMFEAYESDLTWIRKGSKVSFTTRSLPGKKFESRVSFIDPVVNPATRVAYVRAEYNNRSGDLKPGMFTRGTIHSSLRGSGEELVIPKTAVLWTGERSVVYVRDENASVPTFEYREVVLGPETGDAFIISAGLQEGELVVTNGVFTVDAAAQLMGKQSMMNTEAGPAPQGHSGHGAGSDHQEESPELSILKAPKAFKKQIAALYKQYLGISQAFIESSPKKAKSAVNKFSGTLKKVSNDKLQGKTAKFWSGISSTMKSKSKTILKTSDLEAQRAAFSELSDAMYKTVKQIGLDDETIYYQFCPMAVDGKGAYWLSDKKEIANPYFGKKMSKCGLTKETIK